jgi:NifU-like protein
MPIPRVLLEHFRSPRNKRPMPDATVSGAIDGPGDGQRLTLFLRLDAGEKIADASFTNTGDRQSDASLSILTSILPGRTIAEAERLDVVDLARPLEITDMPGAVMPALDVLRVAIARLRGVADPFADEGRLICHCFHVREGRIRRVVRERGLTSIEEVMRWTRACGGCRSCRPDIHLILDQERDRT